MSAEPIYLILQRVTEYPYAEEPAVLTDRLKAICELRDWVDWIEQDTVNKARFRGVPWYQIAEIYGIATSTALRRFRRHA